MKTPREQLIHATKVNKIVRSDMDENDKRKALYELGYHPYNVDTVLKPDWAGRVGILVEPIKRKLRYAQRH